MRLENLQDLFPEKDRSSIERLYDDSDFQRYLPKLILERISKNPDKVFPIDSEMLLLLFSRANFAGAEEGCKMAQLFNHYISYTKRFLPLASEHVGELEELKRKNRLNERVYKVKGEDFASRCLFSLSLFYNALHKLYSKYGAPHPEFYREVGKRTFARVGEESISDNFDRWEDFIREKAFAS